MSGYEVFVQPVLLVGLILTVLVMLGRGIYHTASTIEVDGQEISTRKWGYHSRQLLKAFTALGVGLFLIASLVVVPPGQRGVIYSGSGGVNSVERQEGYSLILPLYQTAIMMNVREQKFYTEEAFAQSSDLQEITVHVAVNYFVTPAAAAELYADVGKAYEDTIIAPAVFQAVTQEVGLIIAEDFAAARAKLAADLLIDLRQRLDSEGITITYVAIEDAVFDRDFIASVKRKVIAEQTAAEQFNLIAAAENTAEQAVEIAQGEAAALLAVATAQAEANNVLAASLDSQLLTWQRLITWDGILPATLIQGEDADVLLAVD